MKVNVHKITQRRLQDNHLPFIPNADLCLFKAATEECEKLWGNEIDSERAGGKGWSKLHRPDLVKGHHFGMSYTHAHLQEQQQQAYREVSLSKAVKDLETIGDGGEEDLIAKYASLTAIAQIDEEPSLSQIHQLEKDLENQREESAIEQGGEAQVEQSGGVESSAAAAASGSRQREGRHQHSRDTRLHCRFVYVYRRRGGEEGRVNGSNSESSQKKADSVPEFHFGPGDVVDIFGLQSEKGRAMNGCDGTLEEWDNSARRWTARLLSGALARLKEENLGLVQVLERMEIAVEAAVRAYSKAADDPFRRKFCEALRRGQQPARQQTRINSKRGGGGSQRGERGGNRGIAEWRRGGLKDTGFSSAIVNGGDSAAGESSATVAEEGTIDKRKQKEKGKGKGESEKAGGRSASECASSARPPSSQRLVLGGGGFGRKSRSCSLTGARGVGFLFLLTAGSVAIWSLVILSLRVDRYFHLDNNLKVPATDGKPANEEGGGVSEWVDRFGNLQEPPQTECPVAEDWMTNGVQTKMRFYYSEIQGAAGVALWALDVAIPLDLLGRFFDMKRAGLERERSTTRDSP
uniref:Transmembrane protein n=1 Tax=Chromera velia CCMP2878 TaxID=1169474 RepID=A0A0G4HMB5_9ALVE|eukprot:Cvel_29207.t1-p1 / transcript=Cvel_29207.t1 / gene=Cvel_29207 / organism=Chromera_velia_CCMP2878 / gene_product=hypothetical protein / transcript_product=hypothetical protein / location=Cvel_scaffold3955:862-6296(+) / protein_length=576 / sequence_SO=supercontig / SO=protein_coding / is_pseudo=false